MPQMHGYVGQLHESDDFPGMSVKASADSLKRIPLFRECDTVPLQVLAFSAPTVQFKKDERVVDRVNIAEAAYFILSGTADVFGAGGHIGVAEPGTLLGEDSMILRRRFSVSAIARGPVTTSCIEYDLFLRVAREYPEFAASVMRVLSGRLENTMREFDSVRVMLGKARSFRDL
jgi:CRP-like cAMP-binding protein